MIELKDRVDNTCQKLSEFEEKINHVNGTVHVLIQQMNTYIVQHNDTNVKLDLLLSKYDESGQDENFVTRALQKAANSEVRIKQEMDNIKDVIEKHQVVYDTIDTLTEELSKHKKYNTFVRTILEEKKVQMENERDTFAESIESMKGRISVLEEDLQKCNNIYKIFKVIGDTI